MRGFRWLSARALPWERDLRRCSWQRRGEAPNVGDEAALLAPETLLEPFDPATLTPGERRRTLVIGADDPARRARLLAWGCGEALGGEVGIAELSARAERVCTAAQHLPRLLGYGRLTLDLMLRDASLGDASLRDASLRDASLRNASLSDASLGNVGPRGRRLGLHPREFALLWRLVECEGAPLSAAELIAHVWQLSFRPETNSLAVHVSRLRAKLAQAGLGTPLETVPGGSYRLRPAPASASTPASAPASVFAWNENALDAELGLREDASLLT